jgi:hypothetical protein
MTTPFVCPGCGFAQHPSNAKCLRCGMQLAAKAEAEADAPLPAPPLSPEAWRALGIGFGLAVVIMLIPFTGILFHPLITIVHEMGHAMTGWLFGYPAIPAFDFSEGGGVTTMNEEQSMLGPLIVYVILGVMLWRTRRHLPTTVGLLLCAALYSFLAFTHWHKAVIVSAGHGMELVMASVFLNRAMTGTSLLQADERPAYAMAGFIILFYDISFFWKLAHDPLFRAWYNDGKSYADNDLVVLIDEHWHTTLPAAANLFFFGCFAAIIVARLAYRYEGAIAMWPSKAFGPKSD